MGMDSWETVSQVMSSSLEIPTNRCLCIHSQLQFVDTALQALLLHHGILPIPLAMIKDIHPTGSLLKTLNGIEAIRTELKEVFRSRRRKRVERVRLHVGALPYRPSHVYDIPISSCDNEESTNEACGLSCQELSEVEKRSLNRHFFVNLPSNEIKGKSERMFVFIKCTQEMIGENVEECDLEDLSCGDKSQTVSYSHRNCEQSKTNENCSGIWLRIVPFIVGTKDI